MLLPHILPWASLQSGPLNLFHKAYVIQAVTTVPEFHQTHAGVRCVNRISDRRWWICLTFGEENGELSSWALCGINLILELHNSILTAANTNPTAESSVAVDVFFFESPSLARHGFIKTWINIQFGSQVLWCGFQKLL